jgi:hypothetical protein
VCFALFCCVISLCWGFGSPHVFCRVLLCHFPVLGLRPAPCFLSCSVCVFSVGWGFGSPRVFCLVLMFDFSVLGLRLDLCGLSSSVV